MPKPMHDHEPTACWWYSSRLEPRDDGWHVTLIGTDPVWTAGPLADEAAARRALAEHLVRWAARAKATGAFLAIQPNGVLVTLPRSRGRPRGALPNWRRPRD